MSFQTDFLADERDRHDEQVRAALYDQFLEGKTDAAFGQKAVYNDAVYLEGYLAGLKELPTDPETGKILYYSEAYRTGGYDSPDPCGCWDEF